MVLVVSPEYEKYVGLNFARMWKQSVTCVRETVLHILRSSYSDIFTTGNLCYVVSDSGIQPGVRVTPGVRKDTLGIRKLKKKNEYKSSSIISLTGQNHINNW
jgi:hypothetical protein